MTTSSQVVEVAEILQEISLTQLEPSSRNPRRTVNPADIKELAASIREHGVQVPLIVRKIDFGDAVAMRAYEIVAGHRRYQAACLEKLVTLPCLVRNLSDEEAAEIALIDNLQRVDVPAMEEAEAFGQLLERLGSIAAVAARVGKELAYVAKRLKLRTLTLCSRDALRAKLISIDHALLLARLAEDEQNEALKWCLDHQAGSKKPVEDVLNDRLKSLGKRFEPDDEPDEDDEDEPASRRPRWNHVWEPQSVQRLKEHIECESGTPLDRAPWPMDEDYLVLDAGSCLDCPKNTKANSPLFGDLDIGVAVCTDGGCFKEKTQTFVSIQLKAAAVSHASKLTAEAGSPKHVWTPGDVQVLRVSWKSTSTVPRQLKDGGGVNPAQTFKDGQWEEATKKCEFARPAVTVDWNDPGSYSKEKLRKPGEIVQACIQPKCKVHKKSYEKRSASSVERCDPAAEKAAVEKRKTEIVAENKQRLALAAQAIEGVKTVPAELIRVMALFSAPKWSTAQKTVAALAPGFDKTLKAAKVDSPEFAKAAAACSLEDLKANEYYEASHGRVNFLASVRRLGYTGPDPWAKPETKPAPAKKTLPPEAKKRIAAGVKKAATVPAKAPAKKAPAKKAAAKKAAKKGGRK